MNSSIPKWITVVSALIALLGLFVGFSLYLSPGTFIPDIDFTSKKILYLTFMWGARQIAIAAIIGYSLIRKSAAMLKISLGAYSLMNFQDVLIGFYMPDTGLIARASLGFLLSAAMIWVLSSKTV